MPKSSAVEQFPGKLHKLYCEQCLKLNIFLERKLADHFSLYKKSSIDFLEK